MERILILGASRYDFTDRDGRRVAGVKVNYLVPPDEALSGPDRRGMEPIGLTAAPDVWESLSELPAVYNADFKQRPGAGGKPTLTLVSATVCHAVDLNDAFAHNEAD